MVFIKLHVTINLMNIITAKGLTKYYGELKAVDAIDEEEDREIADVRGSPHSRI